MTNAQFSLLVGDNPFHGISHLSQQRARTRFDQNQETIEHAANLVALSLENGADGFMFSVDQTTLSIIEKVSQNHSGEPVRLYAIAPYAYEYVRKATHNGGVSGLAKSLAKELLLSSNIKVVASNVAGLLRLNLSALLKTYVAYELSRIKAAAKRNVVLESFMLHELVTDMALALNLEGLCKSYIDFLEERNIRPGFETRNFPYLVNKFREWNIDFSKLTLTSAFNKVGFQMCPSKLECEQALNRACEAEVIAMSVLAAGYLKPAEAVGYLAGLSGLSGLVIGVSKERQAAETFRLFKSGLPSVELPQDFVLSEVKV
ncbi:MAG: hypothetical protein NWE96_03630 [Candidatus Bathyarchaeota archaeon]|nr:hypothetical protein [Candidatus Bathyarchaeota archaeon]